MSSAPLEYEIRGWLDTRQRLRRSKMVIVGLVIIGVFGTLAFAHPILQATVWSSRPSVYQPETGFDPAVIHPSGPTVAHPLGTDSLGRDVLSLMSYGLRPTFFVAIASALGAGVTGLPPLAGGFADRPIILNNGHIQRHQRLIKAGQRI